MRDAGCENGSWLEGLSMRGTFASRIPHPASRALHRLPQLVCRRAVDAVEGDYGFLDGGVGALDGDHVDEGVDRVDVARLEEALFDAARVVWDELSGGRGDEERSTLVL